MAGFKQNYIITYDGITERTIYENLEVEVKTPYDWHRPRDIEALFQLIRITIQKDFDKFKIKEIVKVD